MARKIIKINTLYKNVKVYQKKNNTEVQKKDFLNKFGVGIILKMLQEMQNFASA